MNPPGSKKGARKEDKDNCLETIRGLDIGRGIDHAMKFRVRVNGPGSYTFESAYHPGYYLVVDRFQDQGRPFLA